jgi:hypothetical protein
VTRASNDKLTTPLRSSTAAESACSRAAKLGDCLSARWLMKVHYSLATYHGGVADMNKRCAMWLPTFLQRGIHFFGERTQVLAFNNFVLFDRVHLPIIGKRATVVEEDLRTDWARGHTAKTWTLQRPAGSSDWLGIWCDCLLARNLRRVMVGNQPPAPLLLYPHPGKASVTGNSLAFVLPIHY